MIIQPASGADIGFSVDPNGVAALKRSARQNSPDALKSAAQQFEGLFMNMIMKSMREATPKDGLLDSEQGKMFTAMLDQQMAQNLAKRGVGLADMLVRQLSKNAAIPEAAAGMSPSTSRAAGVGPAVLAEPRVVGSPLAAVSDFAPGDASAWLSMLQGAVDTGIPGVLKAALTGIQNSKLGSAAVVDTAGFGKVEGRSRPLQPAHIREFEDKLLAHAEDAARSTGIPAKFMLGQAALETGWGKREITSADGSTSHNIFGVKAGPAWKGKVVETATTEYVNGLPERRTERFKAYDSYGDAFRDYAKMITSNPRYQSVLANAQDVKGFAQGLQRAGYATDPNYAAKLTRIITHSLSA